MSRGTTPTEPVTPPGPRAGPALPSKDLLAIEGLTREHITAILDEAEHLDAARKAVERGLRRTMRGRVVACLFFENSTRTKSSFEIAARALGAHVLHFDAGTSSTSKGETLRDTAHVIESMGVDYLVVRHASSGAPAMLARSVGCSVINAGDGSHEHPTQALLDALTIRRAFGRVEGLRVAIVGDILHSRVARSNMRCLGLLGATVTLVGPPSVVPDAFGEAFGVRIARNLEEGLAGADVVYTLRIQLERQRRGFIPSIGEFRRSWGIDEARMGYAAKNAVLMHPGPVNRGVEVAPELLDSPRSRALDQVAAGVPVRMAVLKLLGEARGG